MEGDTVILCTYTNSNSEANISLILWSVEIFKWD